MKSSKLPRGVGQPNRVFVLMKRVAKVERWYLGELIEVGVALNEDKQEAPDDCRGSGVA